MAKEVASDEKNIPARFKPRARLLIQLGDQLIKNESIALVELIKNSYDADANQAIIYMENAEDAKNGIIIIEDDGYGMDLNTVENVWLEPGSDLKSQKIKKLEASPKYHRLPIGEKGIGRFGVHKLGNVIELTTKKAGSKEVFVRIDWSEFDNYKYLDEVPITITERNSAKHFKGSKTGTYIVIRNLRKAWERGIARNIKRSITALISPFDSIDSFTPDFKILDKPGWFEGLLNWDDVKHYSLFHFRVVINKDSLTDFKYEFTPWPSMPKLASKTIGLENDLVSNFKYLQDEKDHQFTLEGENIGEIVFEGYIFDLDAFVMKLGVTDKKGFKEYLQGNSGVRVFRDGLRIYDYGEPENDWLDLDFRRFQNPTRHVSNNLILGAIYLKRKDSVGLIEKTNREGFVDNNAYKKFRNAILHSLEIVESLRLIDKQNIRSLYGPTPKSEPVLHVLNDLKNYVDDKITSPEVKKEITKYLIKIETDYKRINENLLKAAGAGLSMSVVIHEVEKIILEVQKVLKAEKGSERVMGLVKHLSSLIDGYAEIIRKSAQTNENLIDAIDQALFNTEYRLKSHGINLVKVYKNYVGKNKTKIARNLLIGSLMNIFDNSIFWLERAHSLNQRLEKKIFINISEEENYINIIIADNGTGFLIPTNDITEPFVSAKPGGMGLGLHVVSEIMLAQGGKLTFPEIGDFELPDEFKKGAVVVFAFKK